MPTAMRLKENGEWEVFDFTNIINKYVIENCDAASEAVEVLNEVAVYDNTYKDEEIEEGEE